ncbi:MAG: DUF2911 domain-containing protein [Ferruginibacter sp.]
MLTKNIFAAGLLFCIAIIFSCNEQKNKVAEETITMRIPVSVKDSMLLSIDKSPMDMIYFPEDYPKRKMVTPNMPSAAVRVIYSRPQKKGRTIFADSLDKTNVIQYYGQAWRLGANEATEIEFFKPVTIKGTKIAAGRYIIYCVPYADKWQIIFNSNLYSWGLHIDKAKDVATVELPLIKNDIDVEYFTMVFQEAAQGCNLIMSWGKLKVAMPVNF